MKIILEFDNDKDARLALDAPKLKSVIDKIEEDLAGMILDPLRAHRTAYVDIHSRLMLYIAESKQEKRNEN